MNKLRIVFMGTPEFAVASLDALLRAGAQVVAVVTTPDKPAGRGQQLGQSAVKQYAQQHELPVLQPDRLRADDFLTALHALQADLFVVVAFRMLPPVVWQMPPLGTINLHASLLPAYRGAAPINWAIMRGETVTGVSTFFIEEKIDTGDVLIQAQIPIVPNDTAGSLHDKLMQLGAQVLVQTVAGLAEGAMPKTAQQHLVAQFDELPMAPKIFKETCQIDWHRPPLELHNHVRGLSPYPGAWCLWSKTDGEPMLLKVLGCQYEVRDHDLVPGTWQSDHKGYLKVACAGGFLHLTDLQWQGKKRLAIAEFLRGTRLENLAPVLA